MFKPELALFVLCLSCAHSQPAASPPTAPTPPAAAAPETAPQEISLTSLSRGALLLPGLGSHRRTVTTTSPEAQRYFDQGLQLTYAFNHDEAARSFAKAAALDPSCAMCFWGAALTLGPNYNVPMLPDRAKAAWDALTQARAMQQRGAPVEQALISALSTRYGGPEPVSPEAMQPFSERYAKAMREVARKFPEDADVQVLYAEAMMDTNPWKLWSLKGVPAPGTEEVVAVLERVLAKEVNHPGANHYYIHAVEASRTPGRATASADRLGGLMPGAGHVVHMPAHIYQRTGRYADAAEANRRAVKVDEEYIARAKPFGYYPLYLGHNHSFLAYATSMEGRKAETLESARLAAKSFPHEIVCSMPGMDFLVALPYFAYVRFGAWDEMLAEPRPPANHPVQLALWHHGRGMALASNGRLVEAKQELEQLEAAGEKVPKDALADLSPAGQLLGVAARVLRARIAEKEQRPEALMLWTEAVTQADRLPYSEPADWFYPVRHYLGAALLNANKPAEAEAVYREDLVKNPKNGWALFGLSQALERQKKRTAAAQAQTEFRNAWSNADIQLTATAF